MTFLLKFQLLQKSQEKRKCKFCTRIVWCIDVEMKTSSPTKKIKSIISQSIFEIRKHVLQGAFMVFHVNTDWKQPSFQLMLFISSSKLENFERRRILHQCVYELREIANQNG